MKRTLTATLAALAFVALASAPIPNATATPLAIHDLARGTDPMTIVQAGRGSPALCARLLWSCNRGDQNACRQFDSLCAAETD